MKDSHPEICSGSQSECKLVVGTLTYTRFGLAVTCFWLLLGTTAWLLKDRAGQPIVQFLLGSYGAPDNTSSAIIGALPAVFILFSLPVIGYLSDRYRSNRGRRIPFLAMTIPLIVLSMAGIAASPWLGSRLESMMAYSSPGGGVIECLALFWTLFAFADLVGNLIFGALINDVVPRHLIGRFFGIYRALGLVAGVGFNLYLFGEMESAYGWILLLIGVVAVISLGLLCAKVREGDYPAPPSDPHGWSEIKRDAHAYIQATFGSPFYRLLFIAWALGSTAWNAVNYYGVSFAPSYITSEQYSRLLTLTFSISFLLAYPVGMLADRFHPLRVGMVALTLYAAATLWGALGAITPWSFSVAFVLHGVLSGTYMTATASLLQRLLPRLVFAQLAAAAGASVCLWNIFIVPFAGYVLNANHHDCHWIFLLGSIQAVAGLVATYLLYRAYLGRGGDQDYVAPGEETAADA